MKCWKKKLAFTLAEVLITLGIIGVVVSMTIPTLYNNYCQRQWVAGLTKFASTLQNAVVLWKQDMGCYDTYNCIRMQSLPNNNVNNFHQILAFMKISQSVVGGNTKNWLPNDTLDYYGNATSASFGKVSHQASSDLENFQLQDGTTFSVNSASDGFNVTVDVNGSKGPNRVGKDTFFLTIGKKSGKDIYFYPYYANSSGVNSLGLCGVNSASCDPDNTDPTVGNGASPTIYTILHGQIPDFQQLSQTVTNFKP